MTFGNIYWLYAFIPVLLILLIGFYYSQKKRKQFFKSLISTKLHDNLMSTYSSDRYILKCTMFLLSIFLFFLALAQPRWGYKLEEQKSKGIDILFALDVSKSMLAEDVRPNRLERAKYSILDLTKKLEGDRFGLIAFAGSAFLQCPLTLDYNAFRESLEQTDPSVIYQGGTDIGAAIRTAEPVFAKENNFKILILITDGEDLQESGIVAATNAAKEDIKIYTVGVGTAQGELIPIKDTQNSTDYLRDPNGNIVKTKLDETTLRKIADITGGFYVPLGPKGEGLEQIYYSGLKSIPKQQLSSNFRQVPIEQFQWPLGLGILLLCIETLLSTRKKAGRKEHKVVTSKIAMLLISICLLGLSSNRVEAGVTGAYKAYQKGEFDKSANLYEKEQQKDPENPMINYNLAGSLYKSGAYSLAANALKNALKTQDLELQQKAFYNLGNSYYRWGEQVLQTNPKQSIDFWEESLKSYQNAIELNPKDLECQENLEFVQKKLEDIKQQQQQNQENQKEQQDKQNQDDNKEDSNDNKNESDANNKSTNNSDSDKKDSQGSDNKNGEGTSNEDNNKESPPKDSSEGSEQDKEGQENKSSSKSSKSDKQDQAGKHIHRQMNKEEAGDLLKALQNSEKKLPAVNEKREKGDNDSMNFRDW